MREGWKSGGHWSGELWSCFCPCWPKFGLTKSIRPNGCLLSVGLGQFHCRPLVKEKDLSLSSSYPNHRRPPLVAAGAYSFIAGAEGEGATISDDYVTISDHRLRSASQCSRWTTMASPAASVMCSVMILGDLSVDDTSNAQITCVAPSAGQNPVPDVFLLLWVWFAFVLIEYSCELLWSKHRGMEIILFNQF